MTCVRQRRDLGQALTVVQTMAAVMVVCFLLLSGGIWPAALAAPATVKKTQPAKVEQDHQPAGNPDEYYELHRVLVDTIDQIEQNYVEKIDRRRLIEAAIRGMISELDPHSSYIPPSGVSNFRKSVERQFGGIGIRIVMRDGIPTVLTPLYGTPAYEAGLESGDRILAVDGEPTDEKSLEEVIELLQGEIGSDTEITVSAPDNDKTRNVRVVRRLVRMETVVGTQRRPADDTWDFYLDQKKSIAYVRLTSFARGTASELRKVIEQLQSTGLRGLILDLRFNPGGLLSAAIDVCDLFVEEGRIVSTDGRAVTPRVWEATRPGTFTGFPMAVLVNQYSASASEIVAACLQDQKRAVIVGQRTYGKGSVQNIVYLEDGESAIKLTTAGYIRPSGENIHRFPDADESDPWGVMPEAKWRIAVGPGQARRLLIAMEERSVIPRSKTSTDDGDADDGDAGEEQTPEPVDDPQLLAARRYMENQLDDSTDGPLEEAPVEEAAQSAVAASQGAAPEANAPEDEQKAASDDTEGDTQPEESTNPVEPPTDPAPSDDGQAPIDENSKELAPK